MGVQLFRIRNPKNYFEEIAVLGPLPEAMIGERRIWKLKDENVFYALLEIPYKDVEKILVKAPSADWNKWNWEDLASIADGCRWRGSKLDKRYVV